MWRYPHRRWEVQAPRSLADRTTHNCQAPRQNCKRILELCSKSLRGMLTLWYHNEGASRSMNSTELDWIKSCQDAPQVLIDWKCMSKRNRYICFAEPTRPKCKIQWYHNTQSLNHAVFNVISKYANDDLWATRIVLHQQKSLAVTEQSSFLHRKPPR